MIRIAGGKWKGRGLKVPQNSETRPTSVRVREALFNTLFNGMKIEAKNALDLFAGTGALGFEALSWGCERCVFVEGESRALKALEANITELECGSETQIVREMKVDFWPRDLLRLKSFLPFDLVFSDPPYGKKLTEKVVGKLSNYPELFSPQTLWVAELRHDEKVSIKGWNCVWERVYGEAKVMIFNRAL